MSCQPKRSPLSSVRQRWHVNFFSVAGSGQVQPDEGEAVDGDEAPW